GTFGCNLFNPDDIELNSTQSRVAVIDIRVMNQSVLPYTSSRFVHNDTLTSLQVDWNENWIGFEFAALEFSEPSKNKYKYRIPPFLNTWTEIGTRREITVTNLDPGFYTMEVLGINNEGIWSSEPARIGIKVLPPFWMTNYFRITAVLFVAVTIAGSVWYLSRRKYREKLRAFKYKMAVDRERLRISQDMHDDLGSRLTQIKLMSEFALADGEAPATIRPRIKEISLETEKVMEQIREIVWSLNPRNDKLDDLAEFMISFAQNFGRRVQIPCRITADEEFPGVKLASEARHNLLLVFKEALNNAAKHAQCSQITVSLMRCEQFCGTDSR
ncbi:MAG: triple tyrosine motif-containing protein, partial [Balneolaceae bacterium]|nr:triple tyrosine motif-containing protein [Balneolaceae bacterium]